MDFEKFEPETPIENGNLFMVKFNPRFWWIFYNGKLIWTYVKQTNNHVWFPESRFCSNKTRPMIHVIFPKCQWMFVKNPCISNASKASGENHVCFFGASTYGFPLWKKTPGLDHFCGRKWPGWAEGLWFASFFWWVLRQRLGWWCRECQYCWYRWCERTNLKAFLELGVAKSRIFEGKQQVAFEHSLVHCCKSQVTAKCWPR